MNDCSGCYTRPGTAQCARHSVTTSYWQNFHIWQFSNLPSITYCGHFCYSHYVLELKLMYVPTMHWHKRESANITLFLDMNS